MPESDELPLPIPLPFAGRSIKPKRRPGRGQTPADPGKGSTHKPTNILHSGLLAQLYGQTGRKISSGDVGVTMPRNARMMYNSYQPNLKKALTESIRESLTKRIKQILSTEPHASELKKMRSKLGGIFEANTSPKPSKFISYLSAFLKGAASGAREELIRQTTRPRQKSNKGSKPIQPVAAKPDSLSSKD